MARPAYSNMTVYTYQGLARYTWDGPPPYDSGWVDNAGFTYYTATKKVAYPASVSTKPWRADGWRRPTSWYRFDFELVVPTCVCYNIGVPSFNAVYYFTYSCPYALTDFSWMEYSIPVKDAAVLKTLESMKDEGAAELGLALLERRQTESLFVDTAKKIVGTIRNFKRGLLSGEWKHLRELWPSLLIMPATGRVRLRKGTPKKVRFERLANEYLQIMYGWLPLMHDVLDSCAAVSFYQEGGMYHFSHIGRHRNDVEFSFYIDGFNSLIGWKIFPKMIQRAKCRVDFTVDTQGLATLASLGLTNPLSLVHEVIPWSFVVDWFYPLGRWLNTFDSTLGKTFLAGTLTQTATVGRCNYIVDNRSSLIVEDIGATGYAKGFKMDRTLLGAFPSASPPAFKNPCSPTHVANALALLVSATGVNPPRAFRR